MWSDTCVLVKRSGFKNLAGDADHERLEKETTNLIQKTEDAVAEVNLDI